MADLKGNCVLAQSGGPTCAINASICGVIQEAMKHPCIEGIYGGLNGILGVLREELIDLRKETPENIEGLKRTPSAAIGSCRYKLTDMAKSGDEYERILEVFEAHNIRYFFYNGGNDSMNTADKVDKLAREKGYELRVMGIPKTVDNDLAFTDHCPGFGSVAKYNAAMTMEAGRDNESLSTSDRATVIETMGRDTGWIAAGAGMGHRTEDDAPHLVYFPEAQFSFEQLERDVREVMKRLNRCVIAVSEGIKNEDGEYIANVGGPFSKDAFGHTQLGGVSITIRDFVEGQIGLKCRDIKTATAQRSAMHFASLADIEESYLCGQMAVRQAVDGVDGYMVTLVRESESPYKCGTGLVELAKVADAVKRVPREWINEEGNHITQAMRDYLAPLMQGQVAIEIGADGVPVYVRLEKHLVPRKLKETWEQPA